MDSMQKENRFDAGWHLRNIQQAIDLARKQGLKVAYDRVNQELYVQNTADVSKPDDEFFLSTMKVPMDEPEGSSDIFCWICGERITRLKDAHNSWPLGKPGDKCCDFCNSTYVIPARLIETRTPKNGVGEK